MLFLNKVKSFGFLNLIVKFISFDNEVSSIKNIVSWISNWGSDTLII